MRAQDKRKSDFLIRLFIVSSVLGVAVSYHKVYLFHILGLVIFVRFILVTLMKKKLTCPRLPTKYHYMFYFIFVWYFLSILWSWYRLYSIIYMVYIISGTFLALVVIYYIGKDKNRLFEVFSALGFIVICMIIYCFLEIFTTFRLPHSPYGAEMRVTAGFYGNMNNLSVVMTIVLPFMIFANKKIFIKYIGILSVFVIIISNESRACILAVASMLIIYKILYRKDIKHRYMSLKNALFFLLVILLLFFGGFLYDYQKVLNPFRNSYIAFSRYVNISEVEGYDSVGIRKQLIINGLVAFRKSHGLGIGGGASKYIQEQFSNTRGVLSMHNFWIELLVEGGAIFFVIFILWYLKLFINLYLVAYRYRGEKEGYLGAATSLALLGFFPAAASASSVIYLLPMWVLLGFCVAVLNVTDCRANVLSK
ncbi:O-antigen polymerase [Thermovirga lienii DSM 17291]|uniref:O-antigen polymerase n=1 Tax=Thermovirga lienii (strain ATCC BAA-1197 / DSM 17291 / Cas60314) TaxID=580340 RepID=G7V8Z7_THELD|nr:O-antigen ligase family protein [Thermovirga lienii]AER67531.1 O-antigen polymerase [Thermovirga lienii DSM 17291]